MENSLESLVMLVWMKTSLCHGMETKLKVEFVVKFWGELKLEEI